MYELGQFVGSLLAIWSLAKLAHWILRWRTPVSALGCGLIAGTVAVTVSMLIDPGRSVLDYVLGTLLYIPLTMRKLARGDTPSNPAKTAAKRDRKPRHME